MVVALQHRYSFNDESISDCEGGESGTLSGPSVAIAGGKAVFSSSAPSAVQLPASVLNVSAEAFTIEIWASTSGDLDEALVVEAI